MRSVLHIYIKNIDILYQTSSRVVFGHTIVQLVFFLIPKAFRMSNYETFIKKI